MVGPVGWREKRHGALEVQAEGAGGGVHIVARADIPRWVEECYRTRTHMRSGRFHAMRSVGVSCECQSDATQEGTWQRCG
jgi:hypothetical protein